MDDLSSSDPAASPPGRRLGHWTTLSTDQRALALAALADAPFGGRWWTATWLRRDGVSSIGDVHLSNPDETGFSLCGTIIPAGRRAEHRRLEVRANGVITCDLCLEWLLLPHSERIRPANVTLPEWQLARTLRLIERRRSG